MSDKRLGGKKLTIPNRKIMTGVVVHTLPSMEAAKDKYREAFSHKPWAAQWGGEHGHIFQGIHQRMLGGDMRLHSIVDAADRLIDDALVLDQRLVRRSGWVMDEEGLDIDAASFANGEERCYINRKRTRLSDRATTEPVRIVVSTDSKHIKPENAAAFIAAAKIAEQFRPLEIWWQGGWLFEKGDEAGCGHIFHVPLVNGDLDFTRLQFVLSDEHRDHCSYRIMVAHAYPAGHGWGGGVAQRSHLPNTFDFIKESGMKASAAQVAEYAAKWAGMEPSYRDYISPWDTEQSWRDPNAVRATSTTSTTSYTQLMAEHKRRERDEKAAREREADERLTHIS